MVEAAVIHKVAAAFGFAWPAVVAETEAPLLPGKRLFRKGPQERFACLSDPVNYRAGLRVLNHRRCFDQPCGRHLLHFARQFGSSNLKEAMRLFCGSREQLMHQI